MPLERDCYRPGETLTSQDGFSFSELDRLEIERLKVTYPRAHREVEAFQLLGDLENPPFNPRVFLLEWHTNLRVPRGFEIDGVPISQTRDGLCRGWKPLEDGGTKYVSANYIRLVDQAGPSETTPHQKMLLLIKEQKV